MIRPQGIDNDGAFVVSLDTVWYARFLLLFSAAAMTDTGSKSAFVSTLETYDDPENGDYINYTHYIHYFRVELIMHIIVIIAIILIILRQAGWNPLAHAWYMSLTTANLFYMSFPFRVSWENLLLYL